MSLIFSCFSARLAVHRMEVTIRNRTAQAPTTQLLRAPTQQSAAVAPATAVLPSAAPLAAPSLAPAPQLPAPAPQADLAHMLHQYGAAVAAANVSNSAAAAASANAAAAPYYYQPLAAVLPYGKIVVPETRAPNLYCTPLSTPPLSFLFLGTTLLHYYNNDADLAARQQYVSFAPQPAPSLVPQFVPVSIMDPNMLAAQAQWPAAQSVIGWPAAAAAALFPNGQFSSV